LQQLRTGDSRPLPDHLKAQISREIDRPELVIRQINQIEAERDEYARAPDSPTAMLIRLKTLGPEFATVIYREGLFRNFNNRRQLAAYSG
jgi:transposase